MTLTFRPSMPARDSGRPEPDPADVDRLAREAAMHANRGEDRQAMHCYQLALLMDETQAVTWFNYGNVQRRIGMLDDAVESFEFALRQDPDMYAARYSLAKLLFELGRPLVALSHFRLVTLQNPTYLPAWRHMVQLQWALGDLDSAEADVRAADELWVSSSSKEVLAIVELDGKRIGDGRPGPVFRRMFHLYQEFKQKVMRAGKREAVSA